MSTQEQRNRNLIIGIKTILSLAIVVGLGVLTSTLVGEPNGQFYGAGVAVLGVIGFILFGRDWISK